MKKIVLLLGITLISYQCSVSKISLAVEDLQVENRSINKYDDGSIAGVELNAAEGDGMAIFNMADFKYGTFEIDIKGENNPGRSFVGLAFNISDEDGYEVVYFRPFNFVAEEQIRRDHMVQYVFHPEYTWRKLRTEFPGEFEAEIIDPPDPDDWFTARIEVLPDQVLAYLKGEEEPVLKVRRLTSTRSGKIGLWVGFNSSGRFANVKIKEK